MFLWYSVDYWYIILYCILIIGGYIMSIIQAVITDNFCLMSGDSRATYSNNNTCRSGFNKVIKLNNQILFGVTGNPIHCFNLFDGYCFY